MDLAKWIIFGVIAIIAIVIIYRVVSWKWGKVDKYELQEKTKRGFLDIFDRFMNLFDKKDNEDKW